MTRRPGPTAARSIRTKEGTRASGPADRDPPSGIHAASMVRTAFRPRSVRPRGAGPSMVSTIALPSPRLPGRRSRIGPRSPRPAAATRDGATRGPISMECTRRGSSSWSAAVDSLFSALADALGPRFPHSTSAVTDCDHRRGPPAAGRPPAGRQPARRRRPTARIRHPGVPSPGNQRPIPFRPRQFVAPFEDRSRKTRSSIKNPCRHSGEFHGPARDTHCQVLPVSLQWPA